MVNGIYQQYLQQQQKPAVNVIKILTVITRTTVTVVAVVAVVAIPNNNAKVGVQHLELAEGELVAVSSYIQRDQYLQVWT